MKRRAVCGAVVCLVSLAGCRDAADGGGTEPPPSSDTTSTSPVETSTSRTPALTDWERSTDCEGTYDGMHDSVIRVEAVTNSLDDEFVPIPFSDLSSAEKAIARPVTEEGGYGTCEASDAFDKFVDRVIESGDSQTDDQRVYLERNGTYYRLYVEVADQVYAY